MTFLLNSNDPWVELSLQSGLLERLAAGATLLAEVSWPFSGDPLPPVVVDYELRRLEAALKQVTPVPVA